MATLQSSTFTDLTLPQGTTAERPGSPTNGMVRFNTSFSLLEFYDGTNWRPVTGYSAGTIGAGGTITKVNNNIVHSFTSVGAATFTPSFNGFVQVLVVAGGGAPGGGWAGGGGGGGMIFNRAFPVTAGTNYPVTVANGGARDSTQNGGNSIFSTITANGGGHGGTWDQQTPGNPGGSGGGGANTSIDSSRLRVFGGLGITGQGFPGGSGVRFNDDSENTHNGGGGGGAGGPGWASQDENQQQATHGGPGAASDILGDILYWGGGGGSTAHVCDGGGGDGGVGGGGGGAAHYAPGYPRNGFGHGGGQAINKGQPATTSGDHARYGGNGGTNTGGGGGGAGSNHGAGGSGIVVIRY